MQRVLAFSISLALVTACARKESLATERSPEGHREATAPDVARDSPAVAAPLVVFLGDSITAGFELPAAEAFPALLEARLAARGVTIRQVNAGVSGDTSAGGLRRVDWLLKQRPDVVVVELGGNDGLRGAPIEGIEQNLRTIVEKVRAAGAVPLLLGMRLPPSHGQAYTDGFAALYPRLAEALSVPFVPFFMADVAGVRELNLPDGIHPTARGHVRLAERLEEPLRALLATLDAGAPR